MDVSQSVLGQLDQLAKGLLDAARGAARQMRRVPPDPVRQGETWGHLAKYARAMLGCDLPAWPPADAAAQEECIRTSVELAVHVRAHCWKDKDLLGGVAGQPAVPLEGERWAADVFDVLGRLMLPHATPQGWTATLVTDLAAGDKKLEAAVKLGKYVLHPTFLAITDDLTRMMGEALSNIKVQRLYGLTNSLRRLGGAPEIDPGILEAEGVFGHLVPLPTREPDDLPARSRRVLEVDDPEPDAPDDLSRSSSVLEVDDPEPDTPDDLSWSRDALEVHELASDTQTPDGIGVRKPPRTRQVGSRKRGIRPPGGGLGL